MNSTHKDYHFAVIVEKREDSYVAYCPQLPEGGHSDAKSIEEAIEVLQSAIGIVVKEMIENGEEVPQTDMVLMTITEIVL